MVIVDEIIKTRNLNLFNECYEMNIKTNWRENVRACPDDETPFFIFLLLMFLKVILLIYGIAVY